MQRVACRLVCTLLHTCGSFFNKGSSRRRLDRFLLFFQAYCFSKQALPLDVEFDVAELFERLRPNMHRLPDAEATSQVRGCWIHRSFTPATSDNAALALTTASCESSCSQPYLLASDICFFFWQAVQELLEKEAAKRGGAARAWYEDDSSSGDEEDAAAPDDKAKEATGGAGH